MKAHAAAAPFIDFGEDIFGQKRDLSGPPDQVIFPCAGLRGDERQQRGSVRRGDHQPALTGRTRNVERDGEPEAVLVELTASFLVANKDGDAREAEVRILPARLEAAAVGVVSWKVAHRRDYSARSREHFLRS